MTDFSPAALKSRWDELTGQRATLDAQLDPKRAELDALAGGTADLSLAEAFAREPALRAEIEALQDELYPIEQERAAIARALGGKTGTPG